MMIFNELRRHGKLAIKRHPMYEKNRFGKIFMYIGAIFWAGYLIFFGTSFAFMFAEVTPNREPYHVMNSVVLIFVLIIDFLMRFPFQNTPTQEVKPYLLLPVKRNRIIDFLLIRSGLSHFNLFWLFMFVPFAIITITKFYGITGVFTYCFGIWLLMLINNYWYLLCRTLIDEHLAWAALPAAVYGGIIAALFIPKDSPLLYFFMDLTDQFITFNILVIFLVLLIIVLLWLANHKLMSKLIYSELNKTNNKAEKISEFNFLERYGEIGEYMRLEVKMMLRNKRCKVSLRTTSICIIAFSALLSFTSVYDGLLMNSFILLYSFSVFGMVILSQIMGFEGNYLDGLMSRKESIMNLFKAKYYVYSIGTIIPFILLIPAIIMQKVSLLSAFSWLFFAIGPIYFLFYQLAVFNKQTVPLNEKITGRQSSGSGLQMIINISVFVVPIILYKTLSALIDETTTQAIFLIIGVGFTLASDFWIQNVYKRFMKRRYENMEGFRDSRQ